MNDDIPKVRRDLASALRQALATTPLHKVTVSSLAAAAGITRQTFYTHFANVYDLTEWAFTTEVAETILPGATIEDWADCLMRLLAHLRDNRDVTRSVYDSIGNDRLAHFYFTGLKRITEMIVDAVGSDLRLPLADKEFVISHYTIIVTGHILHWLATDMTEDPFRLASNLEFILHGSLRASLERLAARQQ